jgi:hypothetical protein
VNYLIRDNGRESKEFLPIAGVGNLIAFSIEQNYTHKKWDQP